MAIRKSIAHALKSSRTILFARCLSKPRMLIMLSVLAMSVTALSYPAQCFDCSTAVHDCQQEELEELNACCQLWGCDSAATQTYCYNRSQERRCGCGLVKGCPQPNCGSNN